MAFSPQVFTYKEVKIEYKNGVGLLHRHCKFESNFKMHFKVIFLSFCVAAVAGTNYDDYTDPCDYYDNTSYYYLSGSPRFVSGCQYVSRVGAVVKTFYETYKPTSRGIQRGYRRTCTVRVYDNSGCGSDPGYQGGQRSSSSHSHTSSGHGHSHGGHGQGGHSHGGDNYYGNQPDGINHSHQNAPDGHGNNAHHHHPAPQAPSPPRTRPQTPQPRSPRTRSPPRQATPIIEIIQSGRSSRPCYGTKSSKYGKYGCKSSKYGKYGGGRSSTSSKVYRIGDSDSSGRDVIKIKAPSRSSSQRCYGTKCKKYYKYGGRDSSSSSSTNKYKYIGKSSGKSKSSSS